MTRNQIIKMARQAGMAGLLTDIVTTVAELENFTALVEAEVRKEYEARIAELEAALDAVERKPMLSEHAVSHCINMMIHKDSLMDLTRIVERQCAAAWGIELDAVATTKGATHE